MIKSYLDFINENFSSVILEPSNQRVVTFTKRAFDEFNEWLTIDRKKQRDLKKLIDQTMRDPFNGSHAEPLLRDKSGKWSKHIDDKNRLVYSVLDKEIKIFSCMGHYDNK